MILSEIYFILYQIQTPNLWYILLYPFTLNLCLHNKSRFLIAANNLISIFIHLKIYFLTKCPFYLQAIRLNLNLSSCSLFSICPICSFFFFFFLTFELRICHDFILFPFLIFQLKHVVAYFQWLFWGLWYTFLIYQVISHHFTHNTRTMQKHMSLLPSQAL